MAPAGVRGIDEYQVGHIERALGVVDERCCGVRGARRSAIAKDPGPQGTEVQEHRGGARAAIEDEHDGPRPRIVDPLRDVAEGVEIGGGHGARIFDHRLGNCGPVADAMPVEDAAVLGAEHLRSIHRRHDERGQWRRGKQLPGGLRASGRRRACQQGKHEGHRSRYPTHFRSPGSARANAPPRPASIYRGSARRESRHCPYTSRGHPHNI